MLLDIIVRKQYGYMNILSRHSECLNNFVQCTEQKDGIYHLPFPPTSPRSSAFQINHLREAISFLLGHSLLPPDFQLNDRISYLHVAKFLDTPKLFNYLCNGFNEECLPRFLAFTQKNYIGNFQMRNVQFWMIFMTNMGYLRTSYIRTTH